MASIRRPMSADTKARYDRIKQQQIHNAQTPSKTPSLPKISDGKEPHVHLMRAKVAKELGQLNTSSDSEGYLRKTLAEDALLKHSLKVHHERATENDASSSDRRQPGDAHDVDETTPQKTSPAKPLRDITSPGNLKPPLFSIRKVSRDRIHERVSERRDFTFGVNEYHHVQSQVRPTHRRSPRKKFSKLPTSEGDISAKQGQGEDTDHRSPSNRESFALEQRLAKLPGSVKIKTPLKTYSRNRTIAASQGGRIPLGEQPAEDDGDDEDAASDSQEDDADIDEIDIEILHLGEKNFNTNAASRHNANGTVSPRSPKRPRDVAKPKPIDRDDTFSPVPGRWDDEDSGQPASKKRRQSSRQIPNVVVRKATIQKLKGQRESKQARNNQEGREVRVAKAKGHKSSQKKTPRTLPVNELVTASQRNDDSEEEDDIIKPMEVPEDPIILSEEEPEASRGRGRKSKTKVSIKWCPGQGFGPIDVSEFRMPQSQAGSVNSRLSTYSDGFVGKEAEPIGRLMPMRQSNRRQSPTQRITVRMGQLTLVAETYSEEDVQEGTIRQRRRRKSQKSATLPSEDARGDDEEDLMLIDNVEYQQVPIHDQEIHEPLLLAEDLQRDHEVKILQQVHEGEMPLQHIDEQERLVEAHESDKMDEEGIHEPMVIDSIELGGAQSHHEEHVDHQSEEEPELLPRNVDARQLENDQALQPFSMLEQKPPVAVKIPSPILRTPANRKSCLKRQPSTNRRVSFAGIEPSQQGVARNSTQYEPKAPNVPPFSQQLKDSSTSRTPSRAREQEELDVYHQLSMVKAPRRPSPDSESDDESEKSVSEEESVEEKSGDEETSDDERELTPAGSSEEGETDEPQKEILDQVAVGEAVQHEPGDDEDMPDQIFVGGSHGEMKIPQVVIHAQKPENLAVPVESQGIQSDLQQIARDAQDIFESGNAIQERSENEQVPSRSKSPDGSWRPTQVAELSSSGVLSENIQPSATCELIERIETAVQAAPIRSEPESNQRWEEDISLDSQNPDSSWRPRQPISTGRLIEVAEDIDTSPTPIPARQRASSQRRSLSQRQAQSRRQSQPLSLVQSRLSPDIDDHVAIAVPHIESPVILEDAQLQPNTGLDSQGSIELGGNQTFGHYRSKVKDVGSQGSTILGGSQPLFARANNHLACNISQKRGDSQLSKTHSNVAFPETQFEAESEPDARESQQSYVPEPVSYFSRASQKLKEPVTSGRLPRTKSTPARTRMAFFGPGNEDPALMPGGITMEEAFAYSPSKTSPVKPSSFRAPARLPTLLEEKSSGQKSLRTLTRQASLGLGTMPGTARRRMMSLPFAPPLKRTPGDEKKASTA